jgi:hypothetical protein
MKEKLLTPINNQLFIVSFIGQGDTTPAQIRIKDTRFKKTLVLPYDHDFRTASHQARAELEKRGFSITAYGYDETTGKGYFLSRDFRSIKEPAPAPTPSPDSFLNQSIHFDAFYNGMDINGNGLLKIKPHAEQYRAFSVKRLHVVPTISRQGTKGEQVTNPHALLTILAYYANHGTDTQKQALKIPVFEYHIESLYDGKEWELSSVDETMQAARATLADYRANQPQYSHRITKKRIGA